MAFNHLAPFYSAMAGGSQNMALRGHPRTGVAVSALAFGCMRLPMLPHATFPRGAEVDEKAAERLLDQALEYGVNYFDTAWPYHRNRSEPIIGAILSRHPRERYLLATKMPGMKVENLEMAKKIFNDQLARCKVDYFDFYQLHGIKKLEDYKRVYEEMGVLDYLLEQKAVGRIRHLGWSFHGDAPLLEYVLALGIPWDYAMLQLNYHDLLHRYDPSPAEVKAFNFPDQPAPTRWMYEKVRDAGIPIVVMEPLLGGRLAKLGKRAEAPLKAARPGWSVPSWAFRYVANLPGVLTTVSGMTFKEHLDDNAAVFSRLEPLTEDDMAALKTALELYAVEGRNRCTACGYCMPCPYGVDIPAIFEHSNNHAHALPILNNQADPAHSAARRAYLAEYRRNVADLRQAAMCTACGQCVKSCPAMINIPAEMEKIARFERKLRAEIL